MLQNTLKKLFGTHSGRAIKKLDPVVADINRFYDSIQSKTDEELVSRTREFQSELSDIESSLRSSLEGKPAEDIDKEVQDALEGKLEEILPEAFAMVKETCRRLCGQSWKVVGHDTDWQMIPYNVQLVGSVILHRGTVAEMKTGEGKTLVATMPIYLNALTGNGVHVITVNDYLAQRDAEWMGEIYKKLGLSVGFILNSMDNSQRRDMYARDITYGTNNEFGFDYLRDNMSLRPEDQVQRGHNFAVVDEVDSVLIDEARTPLIISGAVDAPVDKTFTELRPLVQNLVKKQQSLVSSILSETETLLKEERDDEAGYKLLQATRGMPKHRQLLKIYQEQGMKKLAHNAESELLRDKKLHEADDDLYFSIDEKTHVIDITDKGREAIAPDNPDAFIIPDLGELLHEIDEREGLSGLEKEQEKEKVHQVHAERSGKIHNITQLLRAHTLYEKDVEYVVDGGKVLIVDEFTGRVLPGRRYSDGLHQALEAKENVTVERETQTLATITIQNYFRQYGKLSGMTGTAVTEAEEFGSIYKLEVMEIPTHQDVIRNDRNDLVYKTKREKFNAVIDEIEECNKKGQPVLVGTISVEVSELLSRMLKRKGVTHNVLNAKQHKSEAEIVTLAGQKGAVTIATNMAGRGTDIKLGSGVVDLGGLHIIGTERHESRRIDLQLKGRAGRQGDPGSSRFYLSLEDDLMRLFNSERIANIMDRMGVEEGEVITHGMVTRAIENAQKKVEERNFGIRKHLLEYDDVMNQQRQIVYDIRNQALTGEQIRETIQELIQDFIDNEIARQESDDPYSWDWDGLKHNLASHLLVDADLQKVEANTGASMTAAEVHAFVLHHANEVYATRESLIPEDVMRGFERFVVLRTMDEKWKDHLYAMDQIREGINLRAYGQKNPLLEYKSEGFALFSAMMDDTTSETVQRLFRTQIRGMEDAPSVRRETPRNVNLQHDESTGMGFTAQQPQEQQQQDQLKQPVHADKKVGRNEKVKVISPSGKEEWIKHKKLQQYLNKGYSEGA